MSSPVVGTAALAATGAADTVAPQAGLEVAEMARRVDLAFATERLDESAATSARRATQAYGRVLTEASQLRSVECRETLCRIETWHRDQATADAFSRQQLMSRDPVPWNAPVFAAPSVESELTGGAVTTVTFVAREGRELPSFEPFD